MKTIIKGLFLILLAAGLYGCGSDDAFTGTPTDTTTSTTGTTTVVPASMTIRTDSPTILSDNSNSATITVNVLSSGNVAVPDATVTFVSSGGTLSVGSAVTDANGVATTTLMAGTDPANQTITVTASSSGVADAVVPVNVTGSTATITASRDALVTDGTNNTATVTVTAADAAGNAVYAVPVTLTVDNGAVASLSELSGNTDVNGQFTTTLTGLTAGTVVVTATALGATGTHTFTVDTAASSLLITSPLTGTTALINAAKDITVDIPADITQVSLVTTIGTWVENGQNVLSVSNTTGAPLTVIKQVKSPSVGYATIRASNVANTAMNDEIQLIFVDTTVDGTTGISIQATPTTVAPSSASSQNASSLEVMVRNAAGVGIANAMVIFSITNSTGSGEYVNPPVAYTDEAGRATADFYSGTQSTSNQGVTVTAALDSALTGTLVSDSVNIIVSGTAGSITIGASTKIAAINSDTMYSMPITLMVTDSAGNPVANTAVTLSLWAEKYGLGTWVCEPSPGLWIESVVNNEDIDRDLTRDPGEDISGNGTLTPAASAAGAVPDIVTTDENGVATFNLQYVKESAGFIYDALTATALVQGTETQAVKRFWLPALESDVSGCWLGASPFNTHWPQLAASVGTDTVITNGSTGITVTVTQPDGITPLAGKTISATILSEGTFSAVHPTVVAVSATTDAAGVATFTYTAGDKAGTDWIKLQMSEGSVVIADYVAITAQ